MKISPENHSALKRLFEAMKDRRRQMWPIWRELAAVYLPYRHPWLLNSQKSEKVELNPYYITSEGLLALRTQSAGLMKDLPALAGSV